MPADAITCRLRQTGRAVRCPRRLLHLGHPGLQHHHQHGKAHPQHASVLRAVRAGDHRRANPRQGRRLKAQGHLDGRRGSARLPGRRPRSPVVEDEAEFVRALFRRYLETGSCAPQDRSRHRERSLASSDEQNRQKDRRRPDLARPSVLDPIEPDLCRTAAPQRADPRRPSSGDHRPDDLGACTAKARTPNAETARGPDRRSFLPRGQAVRRSRKQDGG